MGFGNYSADAHRVMLAERVSKSPEKVFYRNDCDPAMNPKDVTFRESRDSSDNPESVGIIFVLDVSSSMGEIPHLLATKTLPTFMECVLTVLPSPQVMFMAVGNARTDHSALQVGQFESTGAMMDRWLSAIHLEGAGGGWGESYELAMYFAARHTAMDCLEKRSKKGYLFMTGDEVPFYMLSAAEVRGLIGGGMEADFPAHEMMAELVESFNVFFLIPDAERAATEQCGVVWRILLHERCVVLEDVEDTALVCALLIAIEERTLPDARAVARCLGETDGLSQADQARVLRTLTPFITARARGPMPPPGRLYLRRDDPGEGG